LTQNGPQLERDRQLQTSRRIDWRFLLPSPHLGQVVYLGPGNGMLLDALNQFSESLKIMSPPYKSMKDRSKDSVFKLAILQSSNLADLEHVNEVLNDHGYLYWEICRVNWQVRLRLRHYRDYVAALERLGFSAMQVNWHRPDFDSCLEIIPLDNPATLKYVFSRRPDDMAGQIKLAIGRGLAQLRLLPRLVPCLSITAYKGLATVEST